MNVLGINALFHDSAAAVVVDGRVVAAAEEERFSRRKHAKRPLPWAAWELPELAARWCLERAGLQPRDLDAVTYSYDPALAAPAETLGLDDPWDHVRQMYARHAPGFIAAMLGIDASIVRYVPHHVAHAASATLAGPFADGDVLVLDGRGESSSHLAAHFDGAALTTHAVQRLPHSIGLLYEDATEHLGFLRSSDEYKVMALASYGTPRFAPQLKEVVGTDGAGGFFAEPFDWSDLVPRRRPDDPWDRDHADLASSVQRAVEEVCLELAHWLQARTGATRLVLAGGVALNCVANTRLLTEGPYDDLWVQPAAGDAGTALGGALHVAAEQDDVAPMSGADLGPAWTDDEIEQVLTTAAVVHERVDDVAAEAARVLADDGIVAWFQGRSEFGPRALGHRSLLASPASAANLERLNDVKGREQFRPVAPMVRLERAAEIFSRGPIPSPYMLFVHDVAPPWRDRIPAVVHVDGTARVQTIGDDEPLVARLLAVHEELTGLPVVVNTSLNTAGRPMVDSPRDALECFGSAPIDLLAIGSFVVRRARA
ncbi:MAG: carbamoyltransferase [Aeromicrobium sp.]|nr:carbamoyltransferase [Aeromicrobium sp.]